MTRDPQKIWLARADREGLREYAWANRTSMGAVVKDAVLDVREHPDDVSVLSLDDTASEVQLSVVIDPDVWEEARQAARSSGAASFTALVRRRIRKILIDGGYLK